MTVSTTSNRISYNGDASSTVFSFPYKFLATSDLKVYVGDVLQTITTDYAVGTPSDTGANVTFVSPPAAGTDNIVIVRDSDLLQQAALKSNGKFPAETVEDMVDKVTLIAQRIRDLLTRSFTLSDSDTTGASLTVPTPAANRAIKWSSDGLSLVNSTYDPDDAVADASAFANSAAISAAAALVSENAAAATYDEFDKRNLGAKAVEPTLDNDGNPLETGAQYFNTSTEKLRIYDGAAWQDTATATPASFTADTFSGTGAQTAFTLSATPASVQSLIVFISGVRQTPTTDYTFSGTTLNFVAAPPLGTGNITTLVVSALAIGTPDNDSVSTAKIQNNAVTADKIADDAVTFAKTQNIATSRLLGRTTASSGDIEELTAGDRLTLTGGALNATAYPVTSGTSVSASGTSVDFTGIPSWAKRITVMLNAVSLNGSAAVRVQLGDAGGIENTGYTGLSTNILAASANATSLSAGVDFGVAAAATNISGSVVFTKLDGSTWTFFGIGSSPTGTILSSQVSGVKALSAALTQLRITSTNGTDTFDAGSINIMYE